MISKSDILTLKKYILQIEKKEIDYATSIVLNFGFLEFICNELNSFKTWIKFTPYILLLKMREELYNNPDGLEGYIKNIQIKKMNFEDFTDTLEWPEDEKDIRNI